jgi:hypothetical protein
MVIQMSDSHASDGQEVRPSGRVSDQHLPGHISSEVDDGLVRLLSVAGGSGEIRGVRR